MLPFLIIHPNIIDRQKKITQILDSLKLNLTHPNVLYLTDDQRLGIENLSQVKQHLNLKPYREGSQVVVIESAQNLTPEAQNSLLKILEEPPAQGLVILASNSESMLLPTIISRCQVENLLDQNKDWSEQEAKYQQQITKLQNSSTEERFKFVEKLEEKEDFLKTLVSFFRKELIKNPKSENVTSFLKDLAWGEKLMAQNINQRAILEYLMLKLPDLN